MVNYLALNVTSQDILFKCIVILTDDVSRAVVSYRIFLPL